VEDDAEGGGADVPAPDGDAEEVVEVGGTEVADGDLGDHQVDAGAGEEGEGAGDTEWVSTRGSRRGRRRRRSVGR